MVAAVVSPGNPNPPTSDEDNDVTSRRPRSKDVNPPHGSSASSSSGLSSDCSRRFPASFLSPRSMRRSSALHRSSRSQFVDWTPSGFYAPLMSSEGSDTTATSDEYSSATRARCTRSLSVSFQGESFFYHMSRAKNSISGPAPTRKHAPERRTMVAATATTTTSPIKRTDGSAHLENSTPGEHHHHSHQRWPVARFPIQSNPVARGIDFSTSEKQSLVASVKSLPHSFLFNDGTRSSLAENHISSDSDSVSTDNNTGSTVSSVHSRSRFRPRGVSIPARFLQDANSWHRQSVVESVVPSAGAAASSPLRGHIGPSSSSYNVTSPSRSMAAGPSSMRNGDVSVGSALAGQPGLAPSIISFAAEVRRAKKGEDRIEEAHLLRLLHNRYLQWRLANARADAVKAARRLTTEKALYNAWINMTEVRDSITIERIKLQLLMHYFKLNSLLKGQMAYLEDWSHMEREHAASLFGSVEVLRTSILHLPVGGVRVDIQDVKAAVASVVDMTQDMGSSLRSICSLLSKAEETSFLVSELCKVVAQEQAFLEQAKELLSTVASLHAIQCSLHAQTLALYRKGATMHHL